MPRLRALLQARHEAAAVAGCVGGASCPLQWCPARLLLVLVALPLRCGRCWLSSRLALPQYDPCPAPTHRPTHYQCGAK